MVRVKMGGYLNEDDKILTKQELDEWILEIQTENARLKEALEMAETYVSSYEFNNEEEYTFIMNQIREALKGEK